MAILFKEDCLGWFASALVHFHLSQNCSTSIQHSVGGLSLDFYMLLFFFIHNL